MPWLGLSLPGLPEYFDLKTIDKQKKIKKQSRHLEISADSQTEWKCPTTILSVLFVILGVKILAYTKDTESEIDIYLGFKYLSENKDISMNTTANITEKIQLI